MTGHGRFIVCSRGGTPMFDLDDRLWKAERDEQVNGPHSLTLETTQRLYEGMRILARDGMGDWHEWAIDEPDEVHEGAGTLAGKYGATWSFQYDLAGVAGGELWVSAEEGAYEDVTAARALEIVLSPQTMWEVGNVTVATTGATSLFDGQVWDYLSDILEVFGGEMEPRIVVDSLGVTHRYVDWLSRIGSETVTRRFDYGEDCTSIHRKEAPGPRYCRIIPRGGNEATDDDGVRYSDRVGIESETAGGVPWIQDDDAAMDFRVPDGVGGWHYPTITVIYDTDDPEELLEKATEDLHLYTRPETTYEASVLQFAAAGMDAHGVALGDAVHIVDYTFGDAPLRLEARVMGWKVNMLDESDVQLTIGSIAKGIGDAIEGYSYDYMRSVRDRLNEIAKGGTLVYLNELLDQINAEINATGGYFYIIPGIGTRTYDVEVEDPTIGAEASQVVEMRGGALRIANSRTSSGDWNWRTVFVAGHILADLVTAANIVSGYIGSASRGSYWNLDTGVMRIGSDASVEGTNCTIIDAGHITTGTIDASVINVVNLNASQIVTGTLDAIAITSCTITGNDIYGGNIVGTTIVGGTISGAEVIATVGNIGGFTLAANALYSGKDSLTSDTSGVYVSTSGISVGNGSMNMVLADGMLYGGSGGITTGYVAFNTIHTQSGIAGARFAGTGCAVILSNSFGVGSYVSQSTDCVYQEGQTATITFMSDPNTQKTIHFYKGIMDTTFT